MTDRQAVSTENAPEAIGPYSQAIRIGDFVYTSGQIPLIPQNGEMIEGGIEEQTRQVLDNLRAVLEAAGVGMDRVVKTTCFLTNLDEFSSFNMVYGEYFDSDPPARSTVGVASLPRGARVEIEAVAAMAGGRYAL